MRFLSLRQQLLFTPETASATSPQPLMTRAGKAVRAAAPAGLTGRQEQNGAGKAKAAVGAPAIPAVDNSPQVSDKAQVSEGGEHLRSLFEVAGAGIMMALFLVAAIFA